MSVEQALDKNVWAVVGASENQEKYGYKIYKKLKQMGYKVYPVNPNYESIQGDKCYPDLKSLPETPEVINMVVAPKHGMNVIEQAGALGVKYAWFQPGSVNEEILRLSEEKGLETIQACILIEAR